MKRFVFILLACCCLIPFGFAQRALTEEPAVPVGIPKLDLEFREMSGTSSALISGSSHHISTTFGADSVIVFQRTAQDVKLLIGRDGNYDQASLLVSRRVANPETPFHYRFEFDSLGTDQAYLVVWWSGRDYWEHASYSGSSEYMCQETIRKQETHEQGVTIVSLHSRKILFEGILEIQYRESQIRNPGRQESEIKRENITKAMFLKGLTFLNIFDHGYEAYDDWAMYPEIASGIYRIVGDQYVMIREP